MYSSIDVCVIVCAHTCMGMHTQASCSIRKSYMQESAGECMPMKKACSHGKIPPPPREKKRTAYMALRPLGECSMHTYAQHARTHTQQVGARSAEALATPRCQHQQHVYCRSSRRVACISDTCMCRQHQCRQHQRHVYCSSSTRVACISDTCRVHQRHVYVSPASVPPASATRVLQQQRPMPCT